MKLGLAISAVILVLAGVIGFAAFYGFSDSPTSATSRQKLAKAELPAGLEPLVGPGGGGDANGAYARVFQYYRQHEKDLIDQDPRKVDGLIDLLVEAMKAQDVREPFLDDQLPLEAGAEPEFGTALYGTRDVVLGRVPELWETQKHQRAVDAAKAVFALGQRALEHSVRLDNRYTGLTLMLMAADYLVGMDEATQKQIQPWIEPLQAIDRQWSQKMQKVLRSAKPKVADLVNIARNDEDRTFRIEATLWLGVAKYNPGSRGNKRLIASALEDLRRDPDPLVSEAATWAQDLTLEEMRKIK